MRKVKVLCVLCVLVVYSFCTTLPFLEAKADYVMKIGHVMAVDSTRHKALEEFKEEVTKKSGGRLQVQIYPAGQLGNEPDLIELLKLGTLEGYVGGTFDALTPKLNLFLVPFMFATRDDFLHVAKSKATANIINDAEKYGIKILSIGDGGSRNITNNVRIIRTPADLRGLKMRTPSVEAYIKTIDALGANPVAIAYGDTYMALRTGVVDGQENPLMNIVTMKFHEVQKYLTILNYIWAPEPFVVSLTWYASLPKEVQQIIAEEAWGYAETQNKLRAELDDYYLKIIRDSGVEIYEPTAEERELFIQACNSVNEYFLSKKYFSREELNAFRSIAKGL